MPEDQENQIEHRDSGGINRTSETARRGSDAAGFVRGLANRRTESDIPSTVPTNVTYDFSFTLKWGAEGTGDGEFVRPDNIEVSSDGVVSL
jgi:hypothetical protein